ncbi:uncharacterized protein [Amphiura filiformis]|uniref:uncharacterized protein n=1 Tax=Amphiura filiformis TaxID=82378 RepID=UPI003B216640
MADIDILGIDELLVVFNLLNLFDKLTAMRVNRRWYNIIKNTHAWKIINFYDRGPADKKTYRRFVSKQGKIAALELRPCEQHDSEWRFPHNEDDVFKFLNTYAGVALLRIDLHVISVKIMQLLHTNCPNLQTLNLFAHSQDSHLGWVVDLGETHLIHFSPNIKHLRLCLPSGYWWLGFNIYWEWTSMNNEQHNAMYRQKLLRAEMLLTHVAQCSNLQRLTLEYVDWSDASMQKLLTQTGLQHLELLNCSFHDRNSPIIPDGDVTFHGNIGSCDSILTTHVGCFTSLTSFSLGFEATFKSPNLHDFFCSISRWETLKKLSLKWVNYSEEFKVMIPGLLNLETLELEGDSVTSSVVTLVGEHLIRLKVLKLRHGTYSHQSLKSLTHHWMLEELAIMDPYYGVRCRERLDYDWLSAIYDIVDTLPKIKYVKLEGHNLSHPFTHFKYPVLKGVDIEVSDVRLQ